MWFSLDSDLGQVSSPVIPLAIYLTISLLIIIENGLVIGFFFPGDTLLIAAGILAGSYSDLDFRWVVATAIGASIVGSQIGYLIGLKYGKVLEKNRNAPSIQSAINFSHKYYQKSEGLSVLISNFLPGMRIFIPIIAGSQKMGRFRFAIVNLLGSISWAGLITFIGYALTSFTIVQENPMIILAGLFTISSFASIVNFFNSL